MGVIITVEYTCSACQQKMKPEAKGTKIRLRRGGSRITYEVFDCWRVTAPDYDGDSLQVNRGAMAEEMGDAPIACSISCALKLAEKVMKDWPAPPVDEEQSEPVRLGGVR